MKTTLLFFCIGLLASCSSISDQGELKLDERLKKVEGTSNYDERFRSIQEDSARIHRMLDTLKGHIGLKDIKDLKAYHKRIADSIKELRKADAALKDQIKDQLDKLESGIPSIDGLTDTAFHNDSVFLVIDRLRDTLALFSIGIDTLVNGKIDSIKAWEDIEAQFLPEADSCRPPDPNSKENVEMKKAMEDGNDPKDIISVDSGRIEILPDKSVSPKRAKVAFYLQRQMAADLSSGIGIAYNNTDSYGGGEDDPSSYMYLNFWQFVPAIWGSDTAVVAFKTKSEHSVYKSNDTIWRTTNEQVVYDSIVIGGMKVPAMYTKENVGDAGFTGQVPTAGYTLFIKIDEGVANRWISNVPIYINTIKLGDKYLVNERLTKRAMRIEEYLRKTNKVLDSDKGGVIRISKKIKTSREALLFRK